MVNINMMRDGDIMNELFEEKINTFLEEAESICNIKFAYIFGSYATGKQNDNSDIDIAIMPDLKEVSKKSELFIRGNLIELGISIFKKDIDIVFLNIDNVFLKYQVIKEGIVIKDNHERISFESLGLREYFDFKYYSNYYNQSMLDCSKSKESRRV